MSKKRMRFLSNISDSTEKNMPDGRNVLRMSAEKGLRRIVSGMETQKSGLL